MLQKDQFTVFRNENCMHLKKNKTAKVGKQVDCEHTRSLTKWGRSCSNTGNMASLYVPNNACTISDTFDRIYTSWSSCNNVPHSRSLYSSSPLLASTNASSLTGQMHFLLCTGFDRTYLWELFYRSLFTPWVANRQTDKDRQKTIQWQNTREEEKKQKKHHPVHNFNANSALIIELVEYDSLWTNDDLRCLSSMSNADKQVPTWIRSIASSVLTFKTFQ